MKYLNDKDLDKYEWIGGGCEELNTFRGKVQEDLAMIENDINVILFNENVINEDIRLTIGPKIDRLIDFIKKEMLVDNILQEYPDIFTKLKELNKIRRFAAHGISYINAEKCKPIVLILTNKEESEGLVFNNNLTKEYEDLYWYCHKFILQLQSKLGYYDHELEEFENQIK